MSKEKPFSVSIVMLLLGSLHVMPAASFAVRSNMRRKSCPTLPLVVTNRALPRATSNFPIRKSETEQQQQQQHQKMMMTTLLPDAVTDSSFWTAVVPIFDGTTVSDPVVVSNVFWANIQSKLVTVLIAQLVATAVFCILAVPVASQVTEWGDSILNKLRENTKNSVERTPLLQKNLLRKATSIQPDLSKLLICIAIDIIGSSSELVPILGEASDIIWAPFAGYILRSLYGSNILFVLEFIEEILPFTDVLPLATLTWVVDTFFSDSSIAQVLQVGMFHPRVNGATSFAPRQEKKEEQKLLPGKADTEDDR